MHQSYQIYLQHCKGSKTVRKKGMSEYLEAEKEAGIYETAQESERGVETTEEHSARKSHQAVAKRAQPSFSERGSSQKKAQRGSGVKAPSQEISKPEVGLETIFSADDESEKKGELISATSLHHRNQRNKGPAILVGTVVLEEPVIVEESAAAVESRAMEET